MTGFDRRLKDLLEKVRAAAEGEGIQWRKAEEDVYAFRAGHYVVTFAKESDPQVAIYDENGEEVEAIDRADLEGRTGADGQPLEEIKARVWRLARRGAGASAPALDKVLDWLDERVGDSAGEAESAKAEPARTGDLGRAHGDVKEPEFSPQAPQAGAADEAKSDAEEAESRSNGNGGHPTRPPWAQ